MLQVAGRNADAEAMALLIDHGANVNVQFDEDGLTPLHLAASASLHDVAKKLLARGANANVADRAAEMPLHIAASRGDVAMARLLIDHGANVNAAGYKGRTPLRCAVEENHESVADLLRQHGAKE
jgi:ankyrin repeat protein